MASKIALLSHQELHLDCGTTKYCDHYAAHPDCERKVTVEVVRLGDQLVHAGQGWEKAATACKEACQEKFRHNLHGVYDAELEGLLKPELLFYLREVAKGSRA